MRLIVFLLLLLPSLAFAQDSLSHPPLIKNSKEYYVSIAGNTQKEMKDVGQIPHLLLDLKYATNSNFMNEKLYPRITTTYVRARVCKALIIIQQQLLQQGLTLKIWDAYRPYSVTRKMWTKVHDERYVANPKNGSGHNKGLAVDCTICDSSSGHELDMGTGFDNFTDSAHADYNLFSATVLANRKTLREVMEKAGFKNLSTEWWHFYLPDTDHDEVLNLSFRDLRKICRKNSPVL